MNPACTQMRSERRGSPSVRRQTSLRHRQPDIVITHLFPNDDAAKLAHHIRVNGASVIALTAYPLKGQAHLFVEVK